MKSLKLSRTKNIKCEFEERIVRLTSIIFLIQLYYTSNLWITERDFPLIPLFEWGVVFQSFQYELFFLLLFLLIWNVITPNKYGGILISIVLLSLILGDVNRLQPWTFIYLIIYILYSINLNKKEKNYLKGGLQLIIVGMFFWSGVSKLNYNFLDATFFDILTKSLKIENTSLFLKFKEIGFVIPFIEISAGLFLLFNKTRKIGIVLVIACHLFIIYFVSPLSLGNDYIVIPWNILMIYLVLRVFKDVQGFDGFKWEGLREKSIKLMVIILVLILPSLNLIGKWDHFLSFSLYSDKMENLLIIVEEEYVEKLPISVQKRFVKSKNIEGGRILNLLDWSFEELKTPYYPESWVLKKISKTFCEYDIPIESLVFLKFKGAFKSENIIKLDCEELNK